MNFLSQSRSAGFFNIIFMKSEILKIGFPINSRLAEDLAPLRDVLTLEGKRGCFVAKGLKGSVFRMLRVQDIARMLRRNTLQAGIVGLDIMIEDNLEEKIPVPYRSLPCAYWRNEVPEMISRNLCREIENILTLSAGKPTEMTVLVRPEDFVTMPIGEITTIIAGLKDAEATVVTSYPNIARASVVPGLKREFLRRDEPFPITVRVEEVAGKVEEIVRNADFEGANMGLDIVRSGETAKACNLQVFGAPVVISSPGLYILKPEKLSRNPPSDQIEDVIQFLKEKFDEAGIQTCAGLGANFVEKGLKEWRKPVIISNPTQPEPPEPWLMPYSTPQGCFDTHGNFHSSGGGGERFSH